MARTQAADYGEKRDAITEHAARLFAQGGFANCSIAELAAACKISKSLIYHYYPSKEDILFDVMNEHIQSLLDEVGAPMSFTDPRQQLRDLTRRLLQHYVGAADRQRVTLYELDNLPEPRRTEIITKQRKIVAQVEGLLSKASGRRGGKKRLGAMTMLYFGMLNWTHTWFRSSGAMSRDQLADLAADTILAAL